MVIITRDVQISMSMTHTNIYTEHVSDAFARRLNRESGVDCQYAVHELLFDT